MTEDEPIFTFDKTVGFIRNFLAAVGLMAVAVLIGLYYGGFFTWLLK